MFFFDSSNIWNLDLSVKKYITFYLLDGQIVCFNLLDNNSVFYYLVVSQTSLGQKQLVGQCRRSFSLNRVPWKRICWSRFWVDVSPTFFRHSYLQILHFSGIQHPFYWDYCLLIPRWFHQLQYLHHRSVDYKDFLYPDNIKFTNLTLSSYFALIIITNRHISGCHWRPHQNRRDLIHRCKWWCPWMAFWNQNI